MVQARQKLVDVELRNKKSCSEYQSTTCIDLTDYVNNDDIVQLVTELQTQLDALEARTMRRTYNANSFKETTKSWHLLQIKMAICPTLHYLSL